MKIGWFFGLDKDERGEFKASFIQSLPVRKQLAKMLENRIQAHFKAQQNRDNYSKANWGYEQADAMGYCRAMNEVKSYLEVKGMVVETKKSRGRPRKEDTNPLPL